MSDEKDDSIPPSEEELAASKRLRDALEDSSVEDPDADLARSLRAAFDPAAIDPAEHAQIVDDVATPEELVLAAELRDALDDDPVVTALRAAWNPTPINAAEHRKILARVVVPVQGRGRVIRVTFGVVAGAMALAASVFVYVSSAQRETAETPLARARSTQPLFHDYDGFKSGSADPSARIDKIAMARAGDYRDNRFTKWGVR